MQRSSIQQYIVQAMQQGKSLSALYSIDAPYLGTGIFRANLEGRTRAIPVPTLKALLAKGLVVEQQRWKVSDHLEHIEYSLPGKE